MFTCPMCHQTRYQVKDGLTGASSQRVRCRACGKRYTPAAKVPGYGPEVRAQAVKLYVGPNIAKLSSGAIYWLHSLR